MNREFFPSMPDRDLQHLNPLKAGQRTGLPLLQLIELLRDSSIRLTRDKRRDIEADIQELRKSVERPYA